jgi:hypothetical protein
MAKGSWIRIECRKRVVAGHEHTTIKITFDLPTMFLYITFCYDVRYLSRALEDRMKIQGDLSSRSQCRQGVDDVVFEAEDAKIVVGSWKDSCFLS